jgi:ABC-type amino acid transport system permease subunit
VNAELVTELEAPLQRATTRARIMSAVGPATAFAGVVWALVQPYRITLLHPRGQGFWWLFVEPPLLVIAVGLFFHLFVVPGLLEDLAEEEHATAQ